MTHILTRPYISLIGLLCFFSNVHSHESLNDDWCDGRVVLLAETTLDGTIHREINTPPPQQQARTGGNRAVGETSCDITDIDLDWTACGGVFDDWAKSMLTATEMCAATEKYGYASVPVVTGPATFLMNEDSDGNGLADHHDLYSAKQGLEFTCAVCLGNTIEPIDPNL